MASRPLAGLFYVGMQARLITQSVPKRQHRNTSYRNTSYRNTSTGTPAPEGSRPAAKIATETFRSYQPIRSIRALVSELTGALESP